MMNTEKISYFEKAGNVNFVSVVDVVKEYLDEDSTIKNIVVFAGKFDSVSLLHEKMKKYDVDITVATYAYGREFYKMTDEEKTEVILPEVAQREYKQKIIELGMQYVQGGLPFEAIRSCTGDNSLEMIVSTFETISKGLVHCVSAAIMARESGCIEAGEKIIALSGDTAIVVTPSLRRDLFDDKFRIHKILCKPY